ncbi:hypothetical protein JOB18_040244 [Solea senegalensis]|uniref:Uncharacterized protein n=1 Tax=Solea senegalensis TaxID=28829 RepID=A0AAV6P7U5_SOLSE|nr:hypothetical protein JOB18_040244 [Solea senegalensis]
MVILPSDLPIRPLGLSRNVYHGARGPGESFGSGPWRRHRTGQWKQSGYR